MKPPDEGSVTTYHPAILAALDHVLSTLDVVGDKGRSAFLIAAQYNAEGAQHAQVRAFYAALADLILAADQVAAEGTTERNEP